MPAGWSERLAGAGHHCCKLTDSPMTRCGLVGLSAAVLASLSAAALASNSFLSFLL